MTEAELYASGMSIRKIAEKLGISMRQVRNRLSEQGATIRSSSETKRMLSPAFVYDEAESVLFKEMPDWIKRYRKASGGDSVAAWIRATLREACERKEQNGNQGI